MHRVFQEFIDAIFGAEDAEGLSNALAKTASALDLSCFAYLALKREENRKPLLISTYPSRWTAHYLNKKYQVIDPVIGEALQNPEPFRWGKSGGRGDTGHLVIGFYTSVSAGNLRASIGEFKKLHPQIELVTMEHSRFHLLTALRNGTVDVVVSPGPLVSKDVKSLLLWSERILISLPQDHCLAAREMIYWADLRNEKILLSRIDPGREIDDLLISKFVLPDDRPTVERHDVSRGIIKNLTSMGMGLSLMMESDIGASFAGLVYRDLHDRMGPSRVEFYAHWRGDNKNPALKRFLDLLAERYPSPPPALGG